MRTVTENGVILTPFEKELPQSRKIVARRQRTIFVRFYNNLRYEGNLFPRSSPNLRVPAAHRGELPRLYII